MRGRARRVDHFPGSPDAMARESASVDREALCTSHLQDHGAAPDMIQLRPRSDRTILSASRTVLVSNAAGQVTDPMIDGLWVDETRVLSRWIWRVARAAPEPCGASMVAQNTWLGRFLVGAPGQDGDPAQRAIGVRITRVLASGLREDVEVTNHTMKRARVPLELSWASDFADRKELRGRRKQKGRIRVSFRAVQKGCEITTRYRAMHVYAHQGHFGIARLERAVRVRFESSMRPTFARARRGGCVRFDLALAPHASFHLSIRVAPEAPCEPAELAMPAPFRGHEDTWAERRHDWLETTTHIDVPDPTVASIINRARTDLSDLRLHDQDSPGDAFTVAAGIPKYVALFGRDTLITAAHTGMLGPELAYGALRTLARTQGTREDRWRDEAPGRIVHEIHTGPLASLKYGPHGRYYGDFTAPARFASALKTLWRWTGNARAVEPFIDVAARALAWADRCALGEDGLYRYRSRSKQGEKNQGWKDSSDAVVDTDGKRVPTPLGTCDMQAYVYLAKLDLAELMTAFGRRREAGDLRTEAERLAARFVDALWMPDEGTVAFGTDACGRVIRSVTSDAAHVLATGILPPSHAEAVSRRLLKPDLFSGWGLRTLSSDHVAYSPFAYHRGTVWPIETCAAVVGMCRYGRYAEAWRLARSLFDLAALFEAKRLPEVVSGDPRDDAHPFPGLYPETGWPQAWSAAAVFGVLEALLGLAPDAPARVLGVDPHLPEWLPRIELHGLRVGNERIDVSFARNERGEADVRVRSAGAIDVRRAR